MQLFPATLPQGGAAMTAATERTLLEAARAAVAAYREFIRSTNSCEPMSATRAAIDDCDAAIDALPAAIAASEAALGTERTCDRCAHADMPAEVYCRNARQCVGLPYSCADWSPKP